MDALTDIIRLLRPQSVLLGAFAASDDWGVRVPPQPGPTFYVVTAGHCWFQAGGAEPVELHEGDYLLSARPETDSFRSAPGIRTTLSDEAFKTRHSVDGEIRLGSMHGAVTRILGGLIVCDPANADLLITLLPPLIHVRAGEESGARLRILIGLLRAEAQDERPGRDAVLARLIEVMLVETLRREVASLPHAGLLAGLADPQLARALADIHGDVARGWTIAGLARRAGMSRSAFARRFSEKLGAAPVEYLLRWRMALARDALRQGRGNLDEVAAAIGYKSASAFSTAFRHRMGCPPRDYAAKARAEERAPPPFV